MEPIYFDYCASTPINSAVLEVMIEALENQYSNPSSVHRSGADAFRQIEGARANLANLLAVAPEEIIFTSGATESNNMALRGVISADARNKHELHVITSSIEHPSVYECCKQLEREGVAVTYLSVDTWGRIDLNELENAIQENTILVSIMHVNNETGVIQPIEEIGRLLKNQTKHKIYLHVDGVQGFGKQQLDMSFIDLYTLSGHKIGGPKGIGLLMVKNSVSIAPLLYGGGQERGMRSGTMNLPHIMAMAEAVRLVAIDKESQKRQEELYRMLVSRIQNIPGIVINSAPLPLNATHILNFSISNIPSAVSLKILDKNGIVASSQSACASKGQKISRTLFEMTGNKELSSSSIRISIGAESTKSEIEKLIEVIDEIGNSSMSEGKVYTLL